MGTLKPQIRQYVTGGYALNQFGPARRRQLDYFLGRLDTSFGDRPLTHLTPAAIERYLTEFAHLAPATRSKARGCAHAFCEWLVREREIAVNPVGGTRPIPVPRRSPRVLSPDEWARILKVLPDERANAICWTAFGCALRRVELARLSIHDYNRRDAMLHVVGKASNERDLPVPVEVADALERYLNVVGWRPGPVFRSYTQPWKGLTAGAIGQMVAAWMWEAGVKMAAWDGVSLHTCRRTAITELIDVSGDPHVGQTVAGHASIDVMYGHYVRAKSARELRAAMDARTLANAPPEHGLRDAA